MNRPSDTDREEVLAYWFGNGRDDRQINEDRKKLWWSKNDAVDREIRERFAGLVEAVYQLGPEAGTTEHLVPEHHLADIICLDQFTRNMYRGEPRCFACDSVALSRARSLSDSGGDRELSLIQRVFAYMPFEHSEVLADQERCLDLFDQLLVDAGEPLREVFEGFCGFARRHHEIVAQFGRFPHRNAILGRKSTPGELAFLEQPGSSF